MAKVEDKRTEPALLPDGKGGKQKRRTRGGGKTRKSIIMGNPLAVIGIVALAGALLFGGYYLVTRPKTPYDKAVAQWSKILKKDPNNAEAHWNLGNIHLEYEKYGEASDEYIKALTLDESYSRNMMSNADNYRRGKDFNRALAHYSALVAVYPERVDFLETRASVYIELDELDKALSDYAQILKHTPDDVEVLYKRAGLLLKQGKYGEARGDFSAILTVKPDEKDRLVSMADDFSKKKEYDSAASVYSALIKNDPGNVDVYYKHAELLLKQEQYDQAKSVFEAILTAKPDEESRLVSMAEDLLKKENYDSAISVYSALISGNAANMGELYVGRARAFSQQEKYEKSFSDMSAAIQLLEETSDLRLLFYDRALIQEKMNNYDGALADYSSAIELDDNLAEAYRGRAIIRFIRGDIDGAMQDAETAIALGVDDNDLYFIRARAYYQQDEYRKAIADFNRLLKSGASGSDLYATDDLYAFRGLSYYCLDDYATAEADLKEAKRLGSNDMLVYFFLGMINYNKAGDSSVSQSKKGYFDLAIENFTKALELNPDLDACYLMRGCVYLRYYQDDTAHWRSEMKIDKEHRKDSALYEKALSDFTDAIRLDGEDAINYYARAMVYHLWEHYPEAISDYSAAARLDPSLYEEKVFSDRKKRAEGHKLYAGIGVLGVF